MCVTVRGAEKKYFQLKHANKPVCELLLTIEVICGCVVIEVYRERERLRNRDGGMCQTVQNSRLPGWKSALPVFHHTLTATCTIIDIHLPHCPSHRDLLSALSITCTLLKRKSPHFQLGTWAS